MHGCPEKPLRLPITHLGPHKQTLRTPQVALKTSQGDPRIPQEAPKDPEGQPQWPQGHHKGVQRTPPEFQGPPKDTPSSFRRTPRARQLTTLGPQGFPRAVWKNCCCTSGSLPKTFAIPRHLTGVSHAADLARERMRARIIVGINLGSFSDNFWIILESF